MSRRPQRRRRRTRPDGPWTRLRAAAGRLREAFARFESRPLGRTDLALVGALFAGSLALYGATAARTVTGEDAGELITAAHVFGVPHPPGYPLWLVLAWCADHLLPFGTVAFRVTLVSVVFSAAANGALLALALKTTHHRLAAVAGAGLFAVSLAHWSQATIPEVYGLNTFLVLVMALGLLRLRERPGRARLVQLAAVAGLACTNHTSAVVVVGIAAVTAVLMAPGAFRRAADVGAAAGAFVLPLALYLVLPLASSADPYLDWGNPETAGALWDHVTRGQYADVEGAMAAERTVDGFVARLGVVADRAAAQFGTPWVLILAGLGLLAFAIRQPGLTLFLGGTAWTLTVFLSWWTFFPLDREYVHVYPVFFIPAWAALAWMTAGGLDTVLGSLASLSAARRRLAASVAGLLLLAVTVHAGGAHHPQVDRSDTQVVAAYGRALLDAMEEGALFLPDSDHGSNAVMYAQAVEGRRPDVAVAVKDGDLDPGVVATVLRAADHGLETTRSPAQLRALHEDLLIERWPGPVYLLGKRDMSRLPGLTLQPCGALFRVMPEADAHAWWDGRKGKPPGLEAWKPFEALLCDIGERDAAEFTGQFIRNELALMKALSLLAADRLDEARDAWALIEGDPAPTRALLNNLGTELAMAGHYDDALECFGRVLEEDPTHRAAWANTAEAHRLLGRPSQAVVALEQAAALDPEDRGLHLGLARLLAEVDRPVEALARYERLAVLDEHDPLPWREAGELLAELGDTRKAIDAFEESLRLDGSQLGVREALQRLRKGAALAAAGAPDLGDAGGDHGHGLQAQQPRPSQPDIPAGLPMPVLPDPTALVQVPDPTPQLPMPPSTGLGAAVASPATAGPPAVGGEHP